MIIAMDTSALIAVLRNEAETPEILEALLTADRACISAATYVETAIVVDMASRNSRKKSQRNNLSDRLDALLHQTGCETVPVSESMALLARAAYRKYGKGTGHKAQLNYGDCFSYALAKELNAPLLFKGSDFIHTDIAAVL